MLLDVGGEGWGMLPELVGHIWLGDVPRACGESGRGMSPEVVGHFKAGGCPRSFWDTSGLGMSPEVMGHVWQADVDVSWTRRLRHDPARPLHLAWPMAAVQLPCLSGRINTNLRHTGQVGHDICVIKTYRIISRVCWANTV